MKDKKLKDIYRDLKSAIEYLEYLRDTLVVHDTHKGAAQFDEFIDKKIQEFINLSLGEECFVKKFGKARVRGGFVVDLMYDKVLEGDSYSKTVKGLKKLHNAGMCELQRLSLKGDL